MISEWGYSSLNYLSNLPVDVIKIDRSLTQQLPESEKQRALLSSVVEVAEINSLMVVAEGIETEEGEESGFGSRCASIYRAFYYARPMEQRAGAVSEKQAGDEMKNGMVMYEKLYQILKRKSSAVSCRMAPDCPRAPS